MKKYLKRFIQEEDGAELIEVAIAIAIAAVLAGALYGIVIIAMKKITQAGEMIDGIDVAGGSASGASGTGTGTGNGTGAT